jgi:hypothetical protein
MNTRFSGFISPVGLPVDYRSATGNASRDESLAVYLAFETAAAGALFNLNLFTQVGFPPSPFGALGTWPPVFRAYRRFWDAMERLVVVFGQLVILGAPDVTLAAYEFTEAFGAVTGAIEVRRWQVKSSSDFARLHAAASEAFRKYLLAVREDLNLRRPPTALSDTRAEAMPDSSQPDGTSD